MELATTAVIMSVTITTGPQRPARANSQIPIKTVPRIARHLSRTARRLISDLLDGLRQQIADLARHGRQLGVLDRLH